MDARLTAAALSFARVVLPCVLLVAAGRLRAEEQVPAPTAPPNEATRAASSHLTRGLELYGEQRYAEAVEEFKAGQASAEDPRFLYALAQALRLADRCEEAILHYRAFLAASPTASQEAAARANLERCEAQVASGRNELASAPSKPAVTNPPPAPSADTVKRSRPSMRPPPSATVGPANHSASPAWLTDPLGAGLTGGGLLLSATGAVLLWLSSEEFEDAERLSGGASSGTYQDHRERLERGRTEGLLGGIAVGTGLCALTLGILRYRTVAARSPVSVSFALEPEAVLATVGGAL